MESVVYNYAIVKRVSSLEQIRKGLKVMDILDLLSANHEILQPCERVKVISRWTIPSRKIKFEEGNETARSFFIRYL